MKMLSYTFAVMKFFGVWRPLEWSSGWKNYLYWSYTSIVVSVLATSAFTQIVYVLQFIKNVEEIASIAFLLLTEVCAFWKVLSILAKRSGIIGFTKILTNERCKPNGAKEITIQNDFDRRIRRNAMLYIGLAEIMFGFMTVVSICKYIPERMLPFNAWIPFNYSTTFGFWAAFLHQMTAYLITGMMSGAFDTVVTGFMSQACAQLNILKCRLELLPANEILDEVGSQDALFVQLRVEEAERRALGNCIRHHHDIFRFTELLNEAFDGILFMQCAVSSFVLCVSIFILARTKPFTAEFTSLAFYFVCMLTQIFVFCWSGNELIIESMDVGDAVYAMDWTKLNVRTQKSLLIIMVRTLKPIKFTSGNIITLFIDTFITLIKLSYSMFNLLDDTS